jgi:tetratricopeptide (TPR) repeat protein
MFRFAILATIASVLAACAGSKPQPEQQQTTVIIRDTIHKADTLKITDSIFVKETETFKTLQKSIDSLIARGEKEKAIELLKTQVQNYNLVHLGSRTLQLANLLHQSGHSAEAIAILEGFAVYKPVINAWIDSANVLYDKIIATNKSSINTLAQPDSSKLEIINSLTSQIRNLKNTKANPAIMLNLADSLRRIAPGDSVLAWLEKQLPAPIDNSDPFCEEQRKIAAEKFANSRQNKTKAAVFLNEAIEALDRCLAETPSADMRKKVTQNREILAKEKQKHGG